MKIRPKKCDICGTQIQNRRSTLQVVCSPKCAADLAKRKEAAKRKAETRRMKEELMTAKKWIPKLQVQINKLVRYIDKGQDCISSGTPWQDKLMDAGHYYPRTSRYIPIRFHLLNIWAQSKHDNRFEEGNRQGMRSNFILLFGDDVAQEIESLPNVYREARWTANELREAYGVCLRLQKEAKNLPKLSQKARVKIRREYNTKLKLY